VAAGCGGSEHAARSSFVYPGAVRAAAETAAGDSVLAPPDLAACGAPLGSPNRRLTRFELAYAIEDVFAVDASALHALPRPFASIGNTPDILVGRLLDRSERFLARYRRETAVLAETIAERLTTACNGSSDPQVCVIERLRDPAARLWRRSVSADELRGLAPAETAKRSPAAWARAVVSALLESPRFYLLANEDDVGPDGHPTSSASDALLHARRRLASRLALALHSSVPDVELLRRAERGDLDDTSALRAEIRHMLADRRFERFGREFTRQWLRSDRAPLFRPSLESRTLLEEPARLLQFEQQTADFFRQHFEARRPVRQLLSGDAGGLVSSGIVLSALSAPIRGGGDESWLGRGLLVQAAFLCRTFPLAAVYPYELWDGHPLLDSVTAQTAPRPAEPDLLAIRTKDRPCRECHSQLETIGAALRAYDGLGNPSRSVSSPLGGVAGRSLDGPRELARFILDSGRFEPCVAQKLLSYLLFRAVLPSQRAADRCLVDALAGSGEDSSRDDLRDWLEGALSSPAFREQGRQVVHDTPTPSPNADGYRTPVPPRDTSDEACRSFDAGRFLVENCGTSACHGRGTTSAFFAVSDADSARRLLRSARTAPRGYCSEHDGLIDTEDPRASLVVQKLTAGNTVCGSPMPIAGGPRSLNHLDQSCFVRWIEQVNADTRGREQGRARRTP